MESTITGKRSIGSAEAVVFDEGRRRRRVHHDADLAGSSPHDTIGTAAATTSASSSSAVASVTPTDDTPDGALPGSMTFATFFSHHAPTDILPSFVPYLTEWDVSALVLAGVPRLTADLLADDSPAWPHLADLRFNWREGRRVRSFGPKSGTQAAPSAPPDAPMLLPPGAESPASPWPRTSGAPWRLYCLLRTRLRFDGVYHCRRPATEHRPPYYRLLRFVDPQLTSLMPLPRPVDVLVASSSSPEGHPWLDGGVTDAERLALYNLPPDAVVRRRLRDSYATREASGVCGFPGMPCQAAFSAPGVGRAPPSEWRCEVSADSRSLDVEVTRSAGTAAARGPLTARGVVEHMRFVFEPLPALRYPWKRIPPEEDMFA